MVAIVTGNGLGLTNTSLSRLGDHGTLGKSVAGRAGESVFINASNGNLIIQRTDDVLIGVGPDVNVLRTYNSQGTVDGDNNDNWRIGFYRQVKGLTGSLNAAGSSIVRVEADGAERTYTYDAGQGKYLNATGTGAIDSLSYSTFTSRWTWTDGDSRVTETYDWSGGGGKLLETRDIDGNALTYSYTSGLLTRVTTANSSGTQYNYTDLVYDATPGKTGNLLQLNTTAWDGANNKTITRVRYDYDTANRLSAVTVDLSPDDRLVTDGKKYVTSYTYVDATSKRVKTITETNGTSVSFDYDASDRVKQFTEGTAGTTRTTLLSYSGGTGLVKAPLNASALTTFPGTEGEATYTVKAGDSWSSIASTLFGSGVPEAVAALKAQLSVTAAAPTVGQVLKPKNSLNYSVTSNLAKAVNGLALSDVPQATITPYGVKDGVLSTTNVDNRSANRVGGTAQVYVVAVGDSWAMVAQKLYGNNSAETVAALKAALGVSASAPTAGQNLAPPATLNVTTPTPRNPAVQPGALSDVPLETAVTYPLNSAALSTTETQNFTVGLLIPVSPYYLVVTGDTWTTITQKLYGTSAAEATAALKVALGTTAATPTVGQALTPPPTLGYTTTVSQNATLQTSALSDVAQTTQVPYALNTAVLSTTRTDSFFKQRLIPASYVVVSGDTWASITLKAYNTSAPEAVTALRTALGTSAASPTVGQTLSLPQGLQYSVVTTVPPYYSVPQGATWSSIALALYGTTNVADELPGLLGNPQLYPGARLSGLPSVVNDNVTTTVKRYVVQAGATWSSVTQALFGTSNAAAVAALQVALGNPTLSTGLALNPPATLAYNVTQTNTASLNTSVLTGGASYTVLAGDTWASITIKLYGVSAAEAVAALKLALGTSAATPTVGQVLVPPASLSYSTTTTVPAYYRIPAGATWASVALALYGSTNAAVPLATALGNPPLTAGGKLTGLPGAINTTVTTVVKRYVVPAGATWDSVTLALYATNDTAAVAALKTALGNPALTTGVNLDPPATLAYVASVVSTLTVIPSALTTITVLGSPAYTVLAGDTWAGITQKLYATSDAEAATTLQSLLGNPALTPGVTITGLPATLNYNVVTTVAPYYIIPAAPTWSSIALTVYGTANVASQLQSALGNPPLTPGNRLTGFPATLNDTVITTVKRYIVPAGATWSDVSYALYGTRDAAAVTALQAALGSSTLFDGLKLDPPASLTYAVTTSYAPDLNTNAVTYIGGTSARTVYVVVGTETWSDITNKLYKSTEADAIAKLRAALSNPTLTNGLELTPPSTLEYTSTIGGDVTTTITDALNQFTVMRSDNQGRLVELTGPAIAGGSQVVRYAYDASGRLQSATDARGFATTYDYDAQGNQILVRDAAGNTIKRTFGALNQLLTETRYTTPDPDGAGTAQPGNPLTTRYVYNDAKDKLRYVISAEGRVSEYRYNGFGQQTASIQYTGDQYNLTGLAVDAAPSESTVDAWRSAIADKSKSTRVDTAYDFRGQVAAITSYSQLDSTGNVTGQASTTQYIYDAGGMLLKTIQPKGVATTGYDGDFVTQYMYDGLARVYQFTDALLVTTLTTYDDANNKTTTTLANGLSTTRSYNKFGELTGQVQTGGAGLGTTTYTYDNGGRLRQVVDPTGVSTYTLYDAAGRAVGEVDGTGSLLERVFNADNQVVKTIRHARAAVNLATLQADIAAGTNNVTLSSINPGADALDRNTWTLFDQAGRPAKTVDEQGYVTETFYDGASRVVGTTRYNKSLTPSQQLLLSTTTLPTDTATKPDLDGAQDRVTRNFYDQDGRLLATLDAEGSLQTNEYDAAGRLIHTRAYANSTNPAKRATGTLTELLPAADSAQDIHTWNFYDGRNQVVATVDGEGYLTEHEYDLNGNKTKTTRWFDKALVAPASITNATALTSLRPSTNVASNQVQSWTYTDLNQVKTAKDPQGTETTYSYDNVGNLVKTVGASGLPEQRAEEKRFDKLGRVTAELTSEGSAELAKLLSPTPAQIDLIWSRYAVSYNYDQAGRRISSTDQLSQKTLYYYNADGQLTHTINHLGEVTKTVYNALNQATEFFAYAGRLNAAVLATLTGGLADAALDAAVTGIANSANDSHTTLSYDLRGLVQSRSSAITATRNKLASLIYNAFGELQQQTDSIDTVQSAATTYTYNRRGQQTGALADSGGLGLLTRASYDAFGRLQTSTDAQGATTTTSYDRLGRVVQIQDPLSNQRRTEYDAFSRVYKQYDARTNATTYTYDDSARKLTILTPEGISTTTTYNAHGQVVKVIDGNGKSTSYTYDANGQLKTQVQDNLAITVVTNNYDRAGRLTDSSNGRSIKTTFDYDAANRVLKRTEDADGLRLVTETTFDGRGQAITVKDPNGNVTRKEYDLLGRTLTVTQDDNKLKLSTRYTYDDQGRTLTVTNPNAVDTVYTYDRAGRRIQELVDPTGLKLQRDYEYDKNGNVIRAIDANRQSTFYVYDQDDRLVYTVDPLGQVQKTEYDADGRISKLTRFAWMVGATTLSNLAAPTNAAPAERLALLTGLPTSGNAVEHRVYDPDGRLTYTVNALGEVVKFSYDGNGNVTERRAYAKRITLSSWTPGGAPPAVMDDTQDQRVRTVYDALNRAVFSIDGTGAVVKQSFDAVGNVTERRAFAKAVAASTAATEADLNAAITANDATDARTRRVFDGANRVTWSADGTGAVTQYGYDRVGNLTKTVQYDTRIAPSASAGTTPAATSARVTEQVYDTADRNTYTIDSLGTVSRMAYDGTGALTKRVVYNTRLVPPTTGLASPRTDADLKGQITAGMASDISNRVQAWAYDAAGRLRLSVAADYSVTEQAYDGLGHVTRLTRYAQMLPAAAVSADIPKLSDLLPQLNASDSNNRVERRQYDAAGRLVVRVDATNHAVRTDYDLLGRAQTTTQYDSVVGTGDVPIATSGKDRVTSTDYDVAGHVTRTTDALGKTELFTYDGVGNKLSYTNQKGAVWSYTYDAAGRQLTEVSPQVDVTTVGADFSVTRLGKQSIVTALKYDALGRVQTRTENSGGTLSRETSYEYDAAGRQVKVTYPAVPVYQAESIAALGANSAAGTFAPSETVLTLSSQTWYDTLGNAVANRDVAGNLSFKGYDILGRLAYEVDAEGYVSGYSRNTFGDATSATRYGGTPTTLISSYGDGAAVANSSTQTVTGAIAAAVATKTGNRVLTTTFDAMGRAVQVTEPAAYNYDSISQTTEFLGKTATNAYNAFGEVYLSSVSLTPSTSAETRSYYDRAGRLIATLDAGGYLTTQAWDAAGNLLNRTEYAKRPTGPANAWTFGTINTSTDEVDGYDRSTDYSYDQANRKTSETRRNVLAATPAINYDGSPTGGVNRGDVSTTYGYDAVGNLTRATDALGASTYTYYDALGRITAVAAPQRAGADGIALLTPLTTCERDAFGNAVVKTDWANGTAIANESGYSAPVAQAEDRTTLTAYDVAGHAIRLKDAEGVFHFSSYNERGQLAKTWLPVADDETWTHVRTQFQVFQYDKLGRLTHTLTPAPYTETLQSGVGAIDNESVYNAFGEITSKRVDGVQQEFLNYDDAGRLVFTNSGDGVAKVLYYDRGGRNTAQIVSNSDLKTLGLSDASAMPVGTVVRLTETLYDTLGRVVSRKLPARDTGLGGTVGNGQFTLGASITSTSTPIIGGPQNETLMGWEGTNQVHVNWGLSLDAAGAGDVKIEVQYRTKSYDYGLFPKPAVIRTQTRIIPSGSRLSEADVTWADPSNTREVGGLDAVLGVVISKKDINGDWQPVVNQTQFGSGNNFIYVEAPADPKTVYTIETLLPSSGIWQPAGGVNFGRVVYFDLSKATAGTFSYRIRATRSDGSTTEVSNGSFNISSPALLSLNPSVGFSVPSQPSMLAWSKAGLPPGATQVLNYRGPDGTWRSLDVKTLSTPANYSGVDTTALDNNNYEYELLWTRAGDSLPYAHATGTFKIVAANPGSGLPNVTGIKVNQFGGGTSNTVTWDNYAGASSVTFEKRPLGSPGDTGWGPPKSGPTPGAGGYSVDVDTVAGSYEFRIFYKDASGKNIATGTGNYTINPPATPAPVLTKDLPRLTGLSGVVGAIQWNVPAGGTAAVFERRAFGSTTWTSTPVTTSGLASVNVSTLPQGDYEFRITYTNATGTLVAADAGNFSILPNLPNTQATPSITRYSVPQLPNFNITTNPGYLSWDNVGGTVLVESRFLNGSWGPYTTSTVPLNGGTRQGLDISGLTANTYQFRITYTDTSGKVSGFSVGELKISSAPARPNPDSSIDAAITPVAGATTLSWALPAGAKAHLEAIPATGGTWSELVLNSTGTGYDYGPNLAGTFLFRLRFVMDEGTAAQRTIAFRTGKLIGTGSGAPTLNLDPATTNTVTGISVSNAGFSFDDLPGTTLTVWANKDSGPYTKQTLPAASGGKYTLPFDASASGTYRYSIAYTDAITGTTLRASTGSFTLYPQPATPTPVLTGQSATAITDFQVTADVPAKLSWPDPSTSVAPRMEVSARLVGSQDWGGLFTEPTYVTRGVAGRATYNYLGTLPEGDWEYRIQYFAADGKLVASGVGSVHVFPVVAGGPQPPKINSTAITGVPGISVSTVPNKLTWLALAGTATFEYRTSGSGGVVQPWSNPITPTPPSGGLQGIDLTGLPAATYEFRIIYTSAAGRVTAMDTGRVQVFAPTIATPSLTLTTPGYIPPSPRTFTFTGDTTASNAGAISLGSAVSAGVLSLTPGSVNGLTLKLRPQINQTFDRWGNVLSTTDPRNAAWVTRYTYNANNQLIKQTQPNGDGVSSTGGPVTEYYYDKLGRQVGTVDANKNLNVQMYDAGGNLVQEVHADKGRVTYTYNAFGDKVQMVDAVGNLNDTTSSAWAAQFGSKALHTTKYNYDRLGRLVKRVDGLANYYTSSDGGAAGITVSKAPTPFENGVAYVYDAAGRRIIQYEGANASSQFRTTRYQYDLNDHIVKTTLATTAASVLATDAGTITTYDKFGNKTYEQDANGKISRWSSDYYGRVQTHTDLGGVITNYGYNNAGQLSTQTSGRGQNLRYTYDGGGQLVQIQDAALNKTTTYAWDLAGKHVLERTEQGGVTLQDNHLAYDALGRLRDINDGRLHISVDYDAVGNRTKVRSQLRTPTAAGDNTADQSVTDERYYNYDVMNRQTVVDAVNNNFGGDVAANLGARGHKITYDVNGNRVSDTFQGVKVTQSGGGTTQVTSYGPDGEVSTYDVTDAVVYTSTKALVTDQYRYDNLNRLGSVERDGVQIDHAKYDAFGQVVQSGATGKVPKGYIDALNLGTAAAEKVRLEQRASVYDANGRLKRQTETDLSKGGTTGTLTSDVNYSSYDAAGNLVNYTTKDERGTLSSYTITQDYREGYLQKTVAVTSDGKTGRTTSTYDANGHLQDIKDDQKNANDRSFMSDAEGRVLLTSYGGSFSSSSGAADTNLQRQLIVGGEVLGRYGVGVDEINPRNSSGVINLTPLADFSFGYQHVNSGVVNSNPGTYTVRAGDTLQSIAKALYGDASAWYLIADANGATAGSTLPAGQVLRIPNRVGGSSNNANTFKPYDPTQAVGDTTPSLPTPGKNGCGALGTIIMVVVAVVATIYTAGAAAGAFSASLTTAAGATASAASLGSAWAAGTAVLSGAGIGAAAVGAAAVGAAVGSIASQVVGIGIGAQSSFNWKQVALSAVGGGVTAGLSTSFAAGLSATGQAIARAAASSALTQGIGVVTGLQSSFNWKSVAASAAGAGVGSALGSALGQAWGGTPMGDFAARAVSGLAAGATAAAMRGGRISVQQVATDAFGNALGQSIASNMQPDPNYSLAGLGAKFGSGGGGVRLGTGDAGNGLDFQSASVRFPSREEWGGTLQGSQDELRIMSVGADSRNGPLTDAQRRMLAAGRGPLTLRAAAAASMQDDVPTAMAGNTGQPPAQQVVITAQRAPWYERVAYRLQNASDPESNVHVNWARDLSLLGMPSRLMGGLDAIARGPAGYDDDGQPVFWNDRMQGTQRVEEIGLELASVAMLPTPGPRGLAVARSGMAFGERPSGMGPNAGPQLPVGRMMPNDGPQYVSGTPIDYDHVLGADYTPKGKPTGGHSLVKNDVQIVPGTESVPDAFGVYKATVQVPDPAKPGQWLTKTSNNSTNTMFPKDWMTQTRIKVEVDGAWNNPNKVVVGDKWYSVTPSGVKVEGWIAPRTTVYPLYQTPPTHP